MFKVSNWLGTGRLEPG